MLLLKQVYKVIEKILHSTEPYETQINQSVIQYYKVFGDKEFLRELDGCQYRHTINNKEFLIIRNKYKPDDEYGKSIYCDNIILEHMNYFVIILPYDLIYDNFDQDILYKLVNLTVKRIVDTIFEMNSSIVSTSRIYLNFMIDFISIKLLLFDLESQRFLENKFSKEFINLVNQSELDQLSSFFYYDNYTTIIEKMKSIWEKSSNESNDI